MEFNRLACCPNGFGITFLAQLMEKYFISHQLYMSDFALLSMQKVKRRLPICSRININTLYNKPILRKYCKAIGKRLGRAYARKPDLKIYSAR